MTTRFWLGFIALAIYIVLYEWLFHGGILGGLYQATASVWRPEADMQDYFLWMLSGQLLFAFIFCLLFICTRCQANIKDGATYGLLIGLLMASGSLAYYAVLPIPLTLLAWWILGGLIEAIIAGALFGWIYTRET